MIFPTTTRIQECMKILYVQDCILDLKKPRWAMSILISISISNVIFLFVVRISVGCLKVMQCKKCNTRNWKNDFLTHDTFQSDSTSKNHFFEDSLTKEHFTLKAYSTRQNWFRPGWKSSILSWFTDSMEILISYFILPLYHFPSAIIIE